MNWDAEKIRALTRKSEKEAWSLMVAEALQVTRQPLSLENGVSMTMYRDQQIGSFDLFLSTMAWDLWHSFGESVERTSQRLIRWWEGYPHAKAVLILDGLSLRELPWLLGGVEQHGFTLHEVAAHGAELPGDTGSFARALGLSNRSQLQERGGLANCKLASARGESVNLPWYDCMELVDASRDWLFWHHWPDSYLHQSTGPGQGLEPFTRGVINHLSDDDFWRFVQRLATGRRLVITSDHGYAASGLFSDAPNEQGTFLKETFKSGRFVAGRVECGAFVPPVALQLETPHGAHTLALGRRKWKSPGGYPTLVHGGLSLLEVLSPYVAISK